MVLFRRDHIDLMSHDLGLAGIFIYWRTQRNRKVHLKRRALRARSRIQGNGAQHPLDKCLGDVQPEPGTRVERIRF